MTDARNQAWAPVARSRAHELVIQAIEDQIMSGGLAVGDPLPPERELASRLEVSRASAALAARNADAASLAPIRAALERGSAPDVSPAEFNDADTAFHVAIAEAGGNRLVSSMTVAIRESLSTRILAALAVHPDWAGLAQRLHAQHVELFEAIARRDPDAASTLAEEHIRCPGSRREPGRPRGRTSASPDRSSCRAAEPGPEGRADGPRCALMRGPEPVAGCASSSFSGLEAPFPGLEPES
ncbi:MAG: transcriptional regulator, GntR family [Microbacterium sp.]|nr:transcriptional regulator, GntR family [Microbacterium sp.]